MPAQVWSGRVHGEEVDALAFRLCGGQKERRFGVPLLFGLSPQQAPTRPIAISVYQDSLREDKRAELKGRTPPHGIDFFDAETPLLDLLALIAARNGPMPSEW